MSWKTSNSFYGSNFTKLDTKTTAVSLVIAELFFKKNKRQAILGKKRTHKPHSRPSTAELSDGKKPVHIPSTMDKKKFDDTH